LPGQVFATACEPRASKKKAGAAIFILGRRLRLLQTAGFRKDLSSAGYVERQNVTSEYRCAEGHDDRWRAIAADLVSRTVDVIRPLQEQTSRKCPVWGLPLVCWVMIVPETWPISFLGRRFPNIF
jgi:hypothetical protein